jgi:hypothetical protein
MSTPHPPNPDWTNTSGAPSLAEIAALTARLRALSAAGATADELERAAFLADKQELLDRIVAAEPDPANAQGRTRHTHHALIRPAHGPPGLYAGASRGDPAAEWALMPAEMREGIDARHDGLAHADEPDELAVRIAALRARVDAQDADGLDDGAPTTAYDLGDGTGSVHESAVTDGLDADSDTDGYAGGWPR